MISYQKLLKYLKKQRKYRISIKKNYFVIAMQNYHITVFQDQWDDYEKTINEPYHLFHISSNNEQNRCSSYFWVDKKNYQIQNIPSEYFSYGQPNYSFTSSTRTPCILTDIQKLLDVFQTLLNRISSTILTKN